MKKFYKLLALMCALHAFPLFANVVLTDITNIHLVNADFNTNANFKFNDPASNLGSANGGANIREVTGWTRGVLGQNSAAATYEYGFAGTLNVSGTTGFIPATGPAGESGSGQAALGISTAWSGTVTYTQSVTLPAGQYSIVYTAINRGPNAANFSRVGWAPPSGTSVVHPRTSFPLNTWVTDTVTFSIASQTTGLIQVGIAAPNAGSGSVGRIFFDNVKLMVHPVSKVALEALILSATTVANNPQPVGTSTAYAELAAALSAAQLVFNDPNANAEQVIGSEQALSAAIAKVNGAILIHQRQLAWTTLPYDITSLIVNPNFETGNANGWTNVGGFASQNNTAFTLKNATFYMERWQESGNWANLRLSQRIINIPNGIYQVRAAALNNPNTTGGAFVFANEQRVEVFTEKEYSVLVTVTDNQLEFGYHVVLGGNWVAVDNFRISYISDGSPYMVASPGNLFFDSHNLSRTFQVTGGNLTQDVVLTAPAGITLSKSVLTPAEVAAGATITAVFDNATAISNANIALTTGSLVVTVAVTTSADLACFTPLYDNVVNLIPNPYLNSIGSFGGWGHRAVVLGAEAFCGAAAVKFSALTNTWPDGAALDVTGIAWEANATYRVRAKVKTVDGTLAFFASQTDPSVTISIPQSNNEWVLIDQTFVVGQNPGVGFFSLNNVDGASTGRTAYIDNWELYKVPVGTAVIETKDASAPYRLFVHNKQVGVKFHLDRSSKVEFAIYNLKGMLMHSHKASYDAGDNQTILPPTLTSGVYVVKMNLNGQTFSSKIVK